VEDAVTGFLVPPANPHALAEKVVRLLEDEDLARNLGRRARAHVRAKFSLDQCVDSYIKLYRNCQR
jgi:glycosyltransferase involved in cell wall biosynthesis